MIQSIDQVGLYMSDAQQVAYNFETLQDRVKYCADLVGNPSRLATMAGLSRSQVWRVVENGSEVTSATAASIAKSAGVDPGWLITGEGDPHEGNHGFKTPPIKLVQFAKENLFPILFDSEFFKVSISQSPDTCCAFQVPSNEHEVYRKGTWCIVDESQKDSMIDGDYLIEFSGKTQVRYLEFLPTGALRVQGNLKQKEYVLTPDEISLINIIGKVIWSELRE